MGHVGFDLKIYGGSQQISPKQVVVSGRMGLFYQHCLGPADLSGYWPEFESLLHDLELWAGESHKHCL